MAVRGRIGTLFVELDLDTDKFTKAQQNLHKEATRVTLDVEKNYKNLGIKSAQQMDMMRAKIVNSYDGIAHSAKSTADDILRAEKAKNAKLRQLNDQQFGAHKSFMDKVKGGFTQMTGRSLTAAMAITAAFAATGFAIKAAFAKGFAAVENFNTSVASMAAMVVTFSERAEGMTFSDQWELSLRYAREIVPVLENLAAKTLLSGEETTALANAFARAGVFLDASNAKQIESFTRISNALPLMTKGQAIMKQINSEIRAVMTGANAQSSMMLQTLRAVNPQIDDQLKTWRDQGVVLEKIGDLLSGFGPATALLETQWQAVRSTIDTTWTQVLRGGMKVVYNDLINLTITMNSWLLKNKGVISTGILVGWSLVKNTVLTVTGILEGFAPIIKPLPQLLGIIAFGWGGVMAAVKPIGDLIGNQIESTIELVKAIGNAAIAVAGFASGHWEQARFAWNESKKSFARIKELGAESFKIVTQGVGDAIEQYGRQTAAALASGQQRNDSAEDFGFKAISRGEELTKEQLAAIDRVEKRNKKFYEDRFKLIDSLMSKESSRIDKTYSAELELQTTVDKWSEDSFKAQSAIWLKEAQEFADLGRSEADIMDWIGAKGVEWNIKRIADIEKTRKAKAKADIAMLESSGSFVDGMKANWLKAEKNTMTFFKAGQQMARTFASRGKQVISSMLLDGLRGDFSSFGDYLKGFWNSMLRKLSDIVAQMVVEWIAGVILMKAASNSGSWFSGLLGAASAAFGGGGGRGGIDVSGINVGGGGGTSSTVSTSGGISSVAGPTVASYLAETFGTGSVVEGGEVVAQYTTGADVGTGFVTEGVSTAAGAGGGGFSASYGAGSLKGGGIGSIAGDIALRLINSDKLPMNTGARIGAFIGGTIAGPIGGVFGAIFGSALDYQGPPTVRGGARIYAPDNFNILNDPRMLVSSNFNYADQARPEWGEAMQSDVDNTINVRLAHMSSFLNSAIDAGVISASDIPGPGNLWPKGFMKSFGIGSSTGSATRNIDTFQASTVSTMESWNHIFEMTAKRFMNTVPGWESGGFAYQNPEAGGGGGGGSTLSPGDPGWSPYTNNSSGNFHSGGVVGAGPAQSRRSRPMASDEVSATLLTDERILSRSENARYEGRGGGSKTYPLNLIINGNVLSSALLEITEDGIPTIHARGVVNE